ncbi:DUF1146 domain-containing protein [Lacticaseibacillus thailandensis]|uniref:DUF1146 domain-containing protein n=1 Tax=Lacticaseibacillus thailandensis TaxID=381741 RepID=UPI000A4F407A|nr:DUF1146 domain-containing protein [Lacticaseibacillus thailandensis]
MDTSLGLNAAFTFMSHLVFIIMSWRLLIVLRFDKILKPNRVNESRLLLFFYRCCLGLPRVIMLFVTGPGSA